MAFSGEPMKVLTHGKAVTVSIGVPLCCLSLNSNV